jgi:hypothetical protein
MNTEKSKHTVWLEPEVWDMVKNDYKADGCRTQNEYIQRAIRFYNGYLTANKTGDYLPSVMASTLEGILTQFGDRLGRLLFKLAVEVCMQTRIIAEDSDITVSSLDQLRGVCVQDIKRTNGQLSFRDILRIRDQL